jgi:hypothetical protein
MPRRSAITLEDVASLDTLAAAFWRAARPHRDRAEVQRGAADLDGFLARLRDDVLAGRSPDGRWTAFSIRDPKPRQILAPCFRDRVLHHALMAHMGPVLERALVADTFACRAGKGTLAAVHRAQQHVRRFPWFVKIDVRAYFASDHSILRAVLARRFKDPGLLALCDAILASVPGGPGRGLPIGALTSQYFANSYLDALDRYLLEGLRVRGMVRYMVRYMDDVVWWCDSREAARATLAAVQDFAARERAVAIKASARIGRSAHGVTFLGFRILPGALRLSLRRRRRYAAARDRWERRYAAGTIDPRQLQAGYDAALAITAHASARAWRRVQLRRREPVDA